MTVFYHATSAEKAEAILRDGMMPRSYWATDDVVSYYEETVQDDGDQPVVLKVSLDDLQAVADLGEVATCFLPDFHGLDEPLCFTLEKSEEQIEMDWEGSSKTWEDTLRIIGSFRFMAPIPAEMLSIDEPENGPER